MKRITVGMLAHVDAGKTTLSEALLYESNTIRTLGRVDHKDAFLDTQELEKARGITIFAKQAVLNYQDARITLLDTPGHIDFSSEMERTLSVLDVAVLVISAAAGVQSHTRTVWKLLREYNVPTMIFVNKMDQVGANKDVVMQNLIRHFGDGCVLVNMNDNNAEFEDDDIETMALKDEILLENYLEGKIPKQDDIKKLVNECKIYPVFFGSALKLEGIGALLSGVVNLTSQKHYGDEFGAQVFKIARDDQDNKLTYIKVTGKGLKVKDTITGNDGWEEKVNQIRIYSGKKYETVNEAKPGTVCALTGITKAVPGEGLGVQEWGKLPVLEPVLNYKMMLPQGAVPSVVMPKLMQLCEEEPQLNIIWNEELKEIQIKLMGEIQTQILKSMISERFGIDVEFGTGNIVYKETIANDVIGIGHFEPLRHYAEVHLNIEPGQRGSGVVIASDCREEILDKNWQRLILTHLHEKVHKGVLIGAPITDIKITLISGRAHTKHTEGGDFRQASYRAVRQGLMQAESVLLEPYYDFEFDIPAGCIGRAMMDIEQMKGSANAPVIEGEHATITGYAPVATMQGYQAQLMSYTKGCGQLFTCVRGYEPCHNADEVIMAKRYDPKADINNTPDSVFCAHGAGFVVPWNNVKEYMHVADDIKEVTALQEEGSVQVRKASSYEGTIAQDKELEAIFKRTFAGNKNAEKKDMFRKPRTADKPYVTPKHPPKPKDKYLLVDGYNILFSWDELNELSKINIDAARTKLMDIMCNYQGFTGVNLILVYDAYKVLGHACEMYDYHNIHVVYTKEAQTADSYIEQFAHNMGKEHQVTVATSDRLEQIIIMGQGCLRMSARDFYEEVNRVNEMIRGKIE